MEGSTLKFGYSYLQNVFVSCRLESQDKAPSENPRIVRDLWTVEAVHVSVSLGSLPHSFSPKSKLIRLISFNE